MQPNKRARIKTIKAKPKTIMEVGKGLRRTGRDALMKNILFGPTPLEFMKMKRFVLGESLNLEPRT